jgi:mannose-6-phosphate isomerase
MTSSSPSSSFTPVFKLHPGVQSYDWGKIGKSSLAAQHAEQSVKGFKADDSKPHAEVGLQSKDVLAMLGCH